LSHPLFARLEVPPTQPCFVCGLHSTGTLQTADGEVRGREFLSLKLDLAGGDEPVAPSRILTQADAPDGTQMTQVRDPVTGEAQTLTLVRPVVCSDCVSAMAREFGMRFAEAADLERDQAIECAQVLGGQNKRLEFENDALRDGIRAAQVLSKVLDVERSEKPTTTRKGASRASS
jgi:hypothetical protein